MPADFNPKGRGRKGMMTRRTFDQIVQERRFRFSLCSSCGQYFISNCPIKLDEAKEVKRCPHRKYHYWKTLNFQSLRIVQNTFPEEFESNKKGESSDK